MDLFTVCGQTTNARIVPMLSGPQPTLHIRISQGASEKWGICTLLQISCSTNPCESTPRDGTGCLLGSREQRLP